MAMIIALPVMAAPAAYRFSPGDVIEVTVMPQRDFGRTVTVQPDGKVSYPVVGQFQAAGLTLEQFSAALREGLNRGWWTRRSPSP